MPEQITIIVDKMLCEVAGTQEPPKSLDVAMFRKFLDLNPGIRTVVREAVRPDLWSLEGGPIPEGGALACVSPVHRGGAAKLI